MIMLKEDWKDMEGWNEVSYASLLILSASKFLFWLTFDENSRMFPVFLLMSVFCIMCTFHLCFNRCFVHVVPRKQLRTNSISVKSTSHP